MLGCTPQACKPYSYPASRPKKEPGDSDRDVNGLLGKGPYTSSAKGPGVTCPLWKASKTWQPLCSWGRSQLPFIGGVMSDRLPRWGSGKESACHCRRHKRHGYDPWVRKIPWRRNSNPLQYSCLENSMDRGPWRATESDTTEHACMYIRLSYQLPGKSAAGAQPQVNNHHKVVMFLLKKNSRWSLLSLRIRTITS